MSDLADTIARLQAFELAGANVLYAPSLATHAEVNAVCEATEAPVNVLAHAGLSWPRSPPRARAG